MKYTGIVCRKCNGNTGICCDNCENKGFVVVKNNKSLLFYTIALMLLVSFAFLSLEIRFKNPSFSETEILINIFNKLTSIFK
jgi:hypothetical protein